MARLPRLSVPNCPHHVLHRGNNGQSIFLNDADRVLFLRLLADAALETRVALHAYVLLDDSFRLLLSPGAEGDLARLMQALGRRYVRAFNQAHGRSGTLWEGRFRSTVVEPAEVLLSCMVHMDLAPARAGLAADAAAWPWSSHGVYAGQRQDASLTPPALWWTLGNTPFAREAAYARRVAAGLPAAEQAHLDRTLHGGWALGGAAFLAGLELQTGRRVKPGRPGRPRGTAQPVGG